MAYSDVITRTNAAALIPEEATKGIIKEIPQASACLSLMKRLPNMSRKQLRMPVLSALASAYWLTGEATGTIEAATGLKQTTNMAWESKYVYAEELAVIVPIAQQVLDDSDYDIWAEVKPSIVEAFGIKIDEAILYGTNKPTEFPDDIVTLAAAAGNTVSLGTGADLYDDIWSENGVLQTIRADGYRPNGIIAGLTMEGRLDGLRSSDGQPLNLVADPAGKEGIYRIKGQKVVIPTNGAFDETSSLLISGDWSKAVYAMRQDLTFDIAKEATIHNATGEVQYNLFQQDMVALRVTMRMGWQIPNPINRVQGTATNRCAFGVLTP